MLLAASGPHSPRQPDGLTAALREGLRRESVGRVRPGRVAGRELPQVLRRTAATRWAETPGIQAEEVARTGSPGVDPAASRAHERSSGREAVPGVDLEGGPWRDWREVPGSGRSLGGRSPEGPGGRRWLTGRARGPTGESHTPVRTEGTSPMPVRGSNQRGQVNVWVCSPGA